MVLFLSTCNLFNPDEKIPAYIRIPSLKIETPAAGNQGSASAKITDAWVYIDEKLQGVYPLPARFPVIKEGKVKISIRAGVLLNGIKSTRYDYPYYVSSDTSVTLEPGKTTELNPVIKGYKSSTQFRWMENFEGIGVSLEKSSSSSNDINVTSNSALVKEGVNSGKFEILSGTSSVEIISTLAYTLPIQGVKSFLELDYKNNQAFRIGLYAIKGQQAVKVPVIGLRPSIDDQGQLVWNKVYIELTDRASENYDASGFKVYFESERDSSVSDPLFFIDNIKLISF